MSRRHCIQACLALMMTAMTAVSCHREPIHEPFSNYYLSLEADYSAIHIKPSVPNMYEAVFYDRETHREVGQSYLGSTGGYIYGLGPGTYEMIVYSFDSGSTVVSGLKKYGEGTASTDRYPAGEVSSYNAPSHLMVARDTCLTLPFLYDTEEAYYLYAYPKTVCDTWCIVVKGIKGLQNATSMEFYVSGQSRSVDLSTGEASTREMTIHFPAQADYEKGIIYTPFCTFGKLEGKPSELRLYIVDGNQQKFLCKADITDQFDDPENTGHWIYLEFDLTIEGKKEGGMTPDVDEWDVHKYYYEIN